MAIRTRCPECGQKYALPDATQIKVLACKACGAEVGLPKALPSRPEPPLRPPAPTGGRDPEPAAAPPEPGAVLPAARPDARPRSKSWTREEAQGCLIVAALAGGLAGFV